MAAVRILVSSCCGVVVFIFGVSIGSFCKSVCQSSCIYLVTGWGCRESVAGRDDTGRIVYMGGVVGDSGVGGVIYFHCSGDVLGYCFWR